MMDVSSFRPDTRYRFRLLNFIGQSLAVGVLGALMLRAVGLVVRFQYFDEGIGLYVLYGVWVAAGAAAVWLPSLLYAQEVGGAPKVRALYREGRIEGRTPFFLCSRWFALEEVLLEFDSGGLRFHGRSLSSTEVRDAVFYHRFGATGVLTVRTDDEEHHFRLSAKAAKAANWPFEVLPDEVQGLWDALGLRFAGTSVVATCVVFVSWLSFGGKQVEAAILAAEKPVAQVVCQFVDICRNPAAVTQVESSRYPDPSSPVRIELDIRYVGPHSGDLLRGEAADDLIIDATFGSEGVLVHYEVVRGPAELVPFALDALERHGVRAVYRSTKRHPAGTHRFEFTASGS